MTIRSIYDATNILVKYLNRYKRLGVWYEVRRVYREHFDRHRLIILRKHLGSRHVDVKIYLIYVRKWFESMPKYYPNVDSVGASINLEVLERLIKTGVDLIVYAHETDGLYKISPKEMHQTAKENGWIRVSKKTGEKIVNIPITRLKKISLKEL